MRDLRPTGLKWPATVPAGWRVVPAKGAFIERREKSGPDDVHLTPSQSYGVLPQNEYMRITGNRVVLNLEGQDNMKHVEPDDFVIHLRSFQGGIEWSGVAGKVSMAYTVLTRGTTRWSLSSFDGCSSLRGTSKRSGRRRTSSATVSPSSTPPLPRCPCRCLRWTSSGGSRTSWTLRPPRSTPSSPSRNVSSTSSANAGTRSCPARSRQVPSWRVSGSSSKA